jgi:ribosomal protein S14
MRSNIVKHFNRRFFFNKFECSRNFDLFFVRQRGFDFMFSFIFRFWLTRYCLNCSITRVRNFCFVTGRLRGVLRLVSCSRCIFRFFVSRGIIVGVRRFIW